MECEIIYASTTRRLKITANSMLKEGWEPSGGPFFDPNNNTFCWAVVRKNPPLLTEVVGDLNG